MLCFNQCVGDSSLTLLRQGSIFSSFFILSNKYVLNRMKKGRKQEQRETKKETESMHSAFFKYLYFDF